ncbi:hypothetical protein [Bradyrhizobium sp. AS23.2]|uniref:hypothetical protein n=1 Tax=Bradyrhizobium sp. AS23.2 TaxID=1680155 RepID=UPI0009625C26|nr:hypothetical protein [Bradyrhizobium sp. AS23.2]OKO82166.1 hypothetical protein AC630_13410 [Bradyrhizobium sp. AS23.2]
MIDNLLTDAAAVVHGILEMTTDISGCQTLPPHTDRREAPGFVGSWDTAGGIVGLPVTCRAGKSERAPVIRPTHDVEQVTMLVIALTRKRT